MFLAQVFSDVHYRFEKTTIHPESQIILALGDLSEDNQGLQWLISIDKPVLYVPGNHEFYDSNFFERIKELEELSKKTKVIILHDKVVQAKNVRFIGTTLWSDQFSQNGHMMKSAATTLNDYKLIEVSTLFKDINFEKEYEQLLDEFNLHNPKFKGFFDKKPKHLNPLCSLLLHKKSTNFLYKQLSSKFNGTTVVLTHHAPHHNSLLFSDYAPLDEDNQFLDFFNLKFRGFKNASYASDLSFLLKEFKPQFWFHGHLHNGAHYAYEKTSVISNPIGYEDGQNQHFSQTFLLDLHKDIPIRHHMVLHTLLTCCQKQEKIIQFLQKNILNNVDTFDLSTEQAQQKFIKTYNLFIQPLLSISISDSLQAKNRPSLININEQNLSKNEFIQIIYQNVERNLEKTKFWINNFNETFSSSLNEHQNPYTKFN